MTQGTNQREQRYVYDTCSSCGDTNVLVYELDEKLMCSDDYKKLTANVRFVQHCDRCDYPSSVRDPSHRRNEYLCSTCHEQDGFLVRTSITKRALVALTTALKKTEKLECYAAGYGTDCDNNNLKPRGPWGGKVLCNKHGKTPPKPEKAKKS
jgi:hypothetical protein